MSLETLTPEQTEHIFSFWPEHNQAMLDRLESKHVHVESGDPLEADMILNMGPQHPATHGVLRCLLKLDGETIDTCVLDLGYLHRGIEKLAEYKTYQEFMPYTDRMDYLSPYSNNVAFCLAVEKLAAIEIPERALYIRTIMSELARISSHLLWLGTMVMDTGAISVFLWAFKYREELYSIFDEICGARFTVSHCRIGGVATDISPKGFAMIKDFIQKFSEEILEWEKVLNRNRIWIERNMADEALEYGFTGPNLRACGVDFDIRRFEPYMIYDSLDFNIPLREEGDSLARYYVRMEEMKESVKIVKQCLDRIPEGPVKSTDAKAGYASKDEIYYSMEGMIHDFLMTDTGVVPPKGAECYHAIESPKGELGFFLISDGTGHPYRMRLNSPSFRNLQGLEYMLEGTMVADTVVLIGSVDPVMGEADK